MHELMELCLEDMILIYFIENVFSKYELGKVLTNHIFLGTKLKSPKYINNFSISTSNNEL